LDGHGPAVPHTHISLAIDTTLDDRLVIAAIDATLHDDGFVIVIRLVAAIVRLLIAIAAAITIAAIVRASADLHAEPWAAKAKLSVGRSRGK
jgi:hypothetical protein